MARDGLGDRCLADLVDLIDNGLESRQDGCDEDTPEGQGVIAIVPHRQQVGSRVGTGDDERLGAVLVWFVAIFRLFNGGGRDVDIQAAGLFIETIVSSGGNLFVDLRMGGDLDDLALDRAEGTDDYGIVTNRGSHRAERR